MQIMPLSHYLCMRVFFPLSLDGHELYVVHVLLLLLCDYIKSPTVYASLLSWSKHEF